ncbi:MAG TPA: CmcI family methyltransferase [Gaiellaceae bacterium]|nr:CmcI family methyltransferase [Gaiellaceae bacterium]
MGTPDLIRNAPGLRRGSLARRAARRALEARAARAKRRIVTRFHRLFYDSSLQTWSNTRWLGVGAQKCTFDLWVYQEILHELRPAVIVECGTAEGGSALFLASICDLVDHGSIVTIDIAEYTDRPEHPRITYLNGSSIDPEVFARVEQLVGDRAPVLVILDSNHERDHVLAELRLYSALVTPGSYLIVEDSNINGRPILPAFGPGPAEAIEQFLPETDEFFVDRDREKFFLTFNPGGYLRRRSADRERGSQT